MPGLYAEGDLDIVGACVGACERSDVVSAEEVRPGDAVIGLASSGLHTNGYTLARKVLEDSHISYSETPEGFNRSIGEVYLESRIGLTSERSRRCERSSRCVGAAHVTGGWDYLETCRGHSGVFGGATGREFLERARRCFGLIRRLGGVPEDEMRRGPQPRRRVLRRGAGRGCGEGGSRFLRDSGCEAWKIGEVVEKKGGRVCPIENPKGYRKAPGLRCWLRGRAANLQALLDAYPENVAVVAGDRKEAFAFVRARRAAGCRGGARGPAGVSRAVKPTTRNWPKGVAAHDVGLVVGGGGTCGCSPPAFLERFPAILNVHPSLLPKFRGLDAGGANVGGRRGRDRRVGSLHGRGG